MQFVSSLYGGVETKDPSSHATGTEMMDGSMYVHRLYRLYSRPHIADSLTYIS